MCLCVCCHLPFIPDVRLVDVPAGVTQEEGHTGFSPPSFCGACLNFSREKDSPVPFPRRNVKSNFVCYQINRSPPVGHKFIFKYFFVRKNPRSWCDTCMISLYDSRQLYQF